MAEVTVIRDPRLAPFFLKANKGGGFDVFKKSMIKPIDKTKPAYEGERFVGSCKNMESTIKFVIEQKMIANNKNVDYLIEYYKALKSMTEEIRSVFDVDQKKEIDSLKNQLSLLWKEFEELKSKLAQ